MHRALQFGMVICVIAVLAASSQAVSFNRPWNGPIRVTVTSWDMGNIYTELSFNTLVDGVADVNSEPAVLFPGAGTGTSVYYDTDGNANSDSGYNSEFREDGWGIFRVDSFIALDPNTGGDGAILWENGDDDLEIMGMFYGLVDNAVISFGAAGNHIQSEGLKIEMYEQALGTFGNAEVLGVGKGENQGSQGRTGFNDYNGITGGTLILAGESVPGVGPITNLDGTVGSSSNPEFFADLEFFTNTASGQFDTYIDVFSMNLDGDVARDYSQFNTSGQPTDIGTFADFRLDGTTRQNPLPGGTMVGNWTVTDDGSLFGASIPEPLTMGAFGLAFAGLGGYIKKRNRKA